MKTKENIDLILFKIRQGKTERDKVINELYHNQNLKNQVRTMLYKYGGKNTDFNHVFNTSLMQFIKTVVKNKELYINSSINSYVTGIAKYVWYYELRKEKKHQMVSLDEQFNISEGSTPESLVIDKSQKKLLKELLNKFGEKCKQVMMYWANGYKMKEIADLVGYKSEGMAKKKKHLCFKELLSYVKDNPEIKKLLQ